jgi:hypothetical protein
MSLGMKLSATIAIPEQTDKHKQTRGDKSSEFRMLEALFLYRNELSFPTLRPLDRS